MKKFYPILVTRPDAGGPLWTPGTEPEDFPRALTILERVIAGSTLDECGREFGFSKQRCQQLVRWTAQILIRKARTGTKVPNHGSLAELRKHATFWRRQIQKARS